MFILLFYSFELPTPLKCGMWCGEKLMAKYLRRLNIKEHFLCISLIISLHKKENWCNFIFFHFTLLSFLSNVFDIERLVEYIFCLKKECRHVYTFDVYTAEEEKNYFVYSKTFFLAVGKVHFTNKAHFNDKV